MIYSISLATYEKISYWKSHLGIKNNNKQKCPEVEEMDEQQKRHAVEYESGQLSDA